MFNSAIISRGILLSAMSLGLVAASQATVIATINSDTDATTVFQGSKNSAFTTLPAMTGPYATSASMMVTPNIDYAWKTSLSDGTKTWRGVSNTAYQGSGGYSAMYEVPFTIASSVSNATLNLNYSVDDYLGAWNQWGMFIDGNGISGSIDLAWGNWTTEKSTSLSLGALSAGTHHLYFNVVNGGDGPSGIMYSGNITTQAVPEPASIAAIGVGLLGALRRRKKA